MVGLEMPAATKPIIMPMLVTIEEAAPKLTDGNLGVTIVPFHLAHADNGEEGGGTEAIYSSLHHHFGCTITGIIESFARIWHRRRIGTHS